ncbi:MAG: DUF3102 domain-containing protein [Dechloromonas sp.]|nr:DUF3102 domain-containing protein [Dechloromonas sp.]
MATRGRKPLPPPIAGVELHVENVQHDIAVADTLPALEAALVEHQGAILAQYGDSETYNRAHYLEKCRYHMARSAEAALEVGRCLIVMKECEGHGDWLPVLDEIGLEASIAQRMMKVALRFSNAATSQHLLAAAQSKSKLIELMVLDEGEVSALNEGETVRGLKLDDVERMSVSELRRALRQTRADQEAEIAKANAAVSGSLAAKDRLIADGKKRIAELVEEKNRRESMTDGERDAELERELTEAMLLASGSTIPLRRAVDAIRALDHCSQGLYVAMQGAIHRVLTEVESIAADYGISLDIGLPALELGDAVFEDPNADEEFPAGEVVGA